MLRLSLQFFGGRGASSGGGGGGSASGELELPDGSKIEFDGELKYGKDDPNLSAGARKAITDWEEKRVKNKIEYAYAVDADGNPIGAEVKGGKGSVKSPLEFHGTPDAVFSHNHPRGDGILGGTFSGADLNNFANRANKTCRATAKEGTYSISKNKNFNRDGFNAYISGVQAKFKAEHKSAHDAVYADYKNGKISHNDYLKATAKSFNTALVHLHEAYSAGQKKYGYTYTLERRK